MPLTGRRPTLMVSADGMGGSHLPGLLGQVICCSVLSVRLHQAAMDWRRSRGETQAPWLRLVRPPQCEPVTRWL